MAIVKENELALHKLGWPRSATVREQDASVDFEGGSGIVPISLTWLTERGCG